MLKSCEDLSSTRKRLTIEVPSDVIEKEISRGLQDMQKRARIPGFRPGKAPINIIEKRFGKEVQAEVLEKIVPEQYFGAVREAGLTPVASPVLEESYDYQRNKPLSLTVTVEVRPSLESLSYEGITIKDMAAVVTDGEVEALLNSLAEDRAAYELTDEPIQAGDLVTVDYTVQEDGTVARDTVFKIGSGPFPQQFFEGLTGQKKDADVTVRAVFPSDTATPFAGKEVEFAVRIKDVKRKKAQIPDDEFAKDLGFTTLEELRARIRERALATKEREAAKVKQMQVLDSLLKTHEFDAPESLTEAELDTMVGEAVASGRQEKSAEDLRAEFRPQAERNIKASLILDMIGEKEGIKVSEEEVKGEIVATAKKVNLSPEDVMKYYITRDGSLARFQHMLFERKVLDLLVSRANVIQGESV